MLKSIAANLHPNGNYVGISEEDQILFKINPKNKTVEVKAYRPDQENMTLNIDYIIVTHPHPVFGKVSLEEGQSYDSTQQASNLNILNGVSFPTSIVILYN
jgi:hypothetical protein